MSGDTAGNFEKLFSKVAKVNQAHGPFAALLCVGSFFGKAGKLSDRNHAMDRRPGMFFGRVVIVGLS